MKKLFLAGAALLALAVSTAAQAQSADKILNASYDISRELFAQINEAYVAKNPGKTIDQSHGGSSRQARAIHEGSRRTWSPSTR